MAQYRASISGMRGQASRLGSKASGIRADVNGWHVGVTVMGGYGERDGDGFEVFATSGSSPDQHSIAVARITRDGDRIRIERPKKDGRGS